MGGGGVSWRARRFLEVQYKNPFVVAHQLDVLPCLFIVNLGDYLVVGLRVLVFSFCVRFPLRGNKDDSGGYFQSPHISISFRHFAAALYDVKIHGYGSFCGIFLKKE